MSLPYSRTASLDDYLEKKTQLSSAPYAERSSSLHFHSSAAVSAECGPQFSCAIKDHYGSSTSLYRFLLWVAYDRNLAGRSQITDDERLRCPIIWCRGAFHDQNKLMEHVFRCARFSGGRYWCFHCQNEESFAPCHAPAFRKERLSVRAKRILRWIGTKSHRKDHETLDPSAHDKGAFCISNNQCSAHQPYPSENLHTTVEMDGLDLCQELGGANYTSYAELDSPPAELDSEHQPASLHSSFRRYPASNNDTSPPSELADSSFKIQQPPEQFRVRIKSISAVSEGTLPHLQSTIPISSNGQMAASFDGDFCESPTETDLSSDSIFSKSFGSDISLPSTRNSTMQSLSSSSLVNEKPLEYIPPLPVITNMLDEITDVTPKEKVMDARLAINNEVDSFNLHSIKGEVSVYPGYSHWHSSQALLHDFWKVLVLHVRDSSEKLKKLPDQPSTDGLLSMTAENIAYTGLSTWKGIVNGNIPATIAQLYALMHIACACAIMLFDDQIEDRIAGLFTNSLAIAASALTHEDKLTYTKIAWIIWLPPLANMNTHPKMFAKLCDQPLQAPSGQSWAEENAYFCPVGVNEQFIRLLSGKGGPVTINSHLNKGDEILNVLALFMDIFEGLTLCSEASLTTGDLSSYSIDESFVKIIKENITTPLIVGYFQPAPSLEAFIRVVRHIEVLVDNGKITSFHELEVALLGAGRSTAQSIELYDIFAKRVKELCSTWCHPVTPDPASRVQRINMICTNLEIVISDSRQLDGDLERRYQSGTGLGASLCSPEHDNTAFYSNVDNSQFSGLSQSSKPQVNICRRLAVKRKRNSAYSNPETNSSPPLSSYSNTLSENSESEDNYCSTCNFRPTGERRWYRRTMTRHRKIHLKEDQKELYSCKYCISSYTRSDNLAAHVSKAHHDNKRQSSTDMTSIYH